MTTHLNNFHLNNNTIKFPLNNTPSKFINLHYSAVNTLLRSVTLKQGNHYRIANQKSEFQIIIKIMTVNYANHVNLLTAAEMIKINISRFFACLFVFPINKYKDLAQNATIYQSNACIESEKESWEEVLKSELLFSWQETYRRPFKVLSSSL